MSSCFPQTTHRSACHSSDPMMCNATDDNTHITTTLYPVKPISRREIFATHCPELIKQKCPYSDEMSSHSLITHSDQPTMHYEFVCPVIAFCPELRGILKCPQLTLKQCRVFDWQIEYSRWKECIQKPPTKNEFLAFCGDLDPTIRAQLSCHSLGASSVGRIRLCIQAELTHGMSMSVGTGTVKSI